MADIKKVKQAIASKTGLSDRQITRLISEKQNLLLSSREIAALAVARDKGVNVTKLSSQDDLSELRGLQGSAQPTASVEPRSQSPAPSPPRRMGPKKVATPKKPSRGRKVFVVYGRNEPIKKDLFSLLRSLDLQPMEWNKGIASTHVASPSVAQIIDALFEEAVAAVVLLTPDDDVILRQKFHKASDPAYEKVLSGQSRPNVLFEAGIAFGRHPQSTVIVQVGPVKPFSDIGGLHITHLSNSPESRAELVVKLQNAGCAVDSSGTEWYSTGNFDVGEEGLGGTQQE